MLYLTTPTAKDLDFYFDLIREPLKAALRDSHAHDNVKNHLTDRRLEEIIKNDPSALIKDHKTVAGLIVAGYNDAEFEEYHKIKNKENKTAGEMSLCSRYSEINILSEIFDYDAIISRSKKTSYLLALRLGRNTCTYCNRLYTNTIIVKDKATNSINNKSRIARPEFDHWFPKGKYPLLALSFYNLIPSCKVCNSSIKSVIDLTLGEDVHPYMKEDDQDFSFNYYPKSITELEVRVEPSNSKIASTLKKFRVEDVYNAHANSELKDLYDLRYKYSENYLDVLLNRTFSSLKIGKEEAYRLIFGTEIRESEFHKRPFSKFKRDILKKLDVDVSH